MTVTEAQSYGQQEWPAMTDGQQTPSDPFSVNELCTKLEAHRVDVKLAEIRERAAKRRQSAALNPTYKPRYSFFGGSVSIPESRGDLDMPDPVDSALNSAGEPEWPEWVSPQAMLAARSRGLSEAEARKSISQGGQSEDQLDTKRKLQNRTSLMFGPWTEQSGNKSATKARPMSMAFAGHGVRSMSSDSVRKHQVVSGEARTKNRFQSQPTLARADWGQSDAATSEGTLETSVGITPELQATFRQKLAQLPPIAVDKRISEVPEGLADMVSPFSHAAAADSRPSPSSYPSADSAISMTDGTSLANGEKGGKRLRLKKSIRNLFGRKSAE